MTTAKPATRACQWCSRPIPAAARADAHYCSTRCRQAAHRFRTSVGTAAQLPVTPARLAYADPPYPGTAARYYRHHRDYAGEVDHQALVARLAAGYDGWALSTSAAALPAVLPMCPEGARVACWIRGARPNRQARRPVNAWEPVIYMPARPAPDPPLDVLIHASRPRTTDPHRVIGAKPALFARWVFELIAAAPGDTLDDLYPGSGGIARAWHDYTGPAPR